MNNLIVTSGKKYIDIDAYAGCIAYSKLLNSMEYNSKAVTSSKYNESISPIIKELKYDFDDYIPTSSDNFIIVDTSDPNMLDNMVDINRIVEIIDHHTGFQENWKHIKTNIEFIGSICTIIFERYKKLNKLDLLDNDLCKLLIAGILDNTLNLKASITTIRDINAYNELLKLGNINEEWMNEYFISCQKEIENNLEEALVNDMKIEYASDILPKVFGQLLVFDKEPIINRLDLIKNVFNKYGDQWILNLISLKEGKSYIFAESLETRNKLEMFFNSKFENGVLVLDKFMLRKEIMKKARESK